MDTQSSAHALTIEDDGPAGVLAFCSCGGWGYGATDVPAARDAHASHLREVSR